MSYEIIKNLSIDSSDGGFYAVITSSASNIFPKYYDTWKYGVGRGWSKEELEKNILLDYFNGNIQGGRNKYRSCVDMIRNESNLLSRYNRLSKLYSKIYNKYHKVSKSRLDEYKALQGRIHKAECEELKEVLYKYLYSDKEVIKFTIKDKFGMYVHKVNKRTYKMGYIAKVFEDAVLWNRVNNHSWWRENFIIERV